MCFTFKKNNKQTKKPFNCFLRDDASVSIQSLQTSIEIKLCQNLWNWLEAVDSQAVFRYHLCTLVCMALCVIAIFKQPYDDLKQIW